MVAKTAQQKCGTEKGSPRCIRAICSPTVHWGIIHSSLHGEFCYHTLAFHSVIPFGESRLSVPINQDVVPITFLTCPECNYIPFLSIDISCWPRTSPSPSASASCQGIPPRSRPTCSQQPETNCRDRGSTLERNTTAPARDCRFPRMDAGLA